MGNPCGLEDGGCCTYYVARVSRGQPTLRAARLVLTSGIQDSLATCASTLVFASVATVRAETVVNLDAVVPD